MRFQFFVIYTKKLALVFITDLFSILKNYLLILQTAKALIFTKICILLIWNFLPFCCNSTDRLETMLMKMIMMIMIIIIIIVNDVLKDEFIFLLFLSLTRSNICFIFVLVYFPLFFCSSLSFQLSLFFLAY